MNIERLREYCIEKRGVEEGFPFGETVLVFKVGGKIFALAPMDGDASVNLKCDPKRAIELREKHPAVQPGYHMNKKHWNTVMLDGSMDDALILNMIDHSYSLVFDSLTKNIKSEILL